jgi:hypothetical protein
MFVDTRIQSDKAAGTEYLPTYPHAPSDIHIHVFLCVTLPKALGTVYTVPPQS